MTHANQRIAELERERKLAAKTLAEAGERISQLEAAVRATCTQILLKEAEAAERRATYHDYYGRKTPEYFEEMRLAQELRDLASRKC